MTIQTNTKPDAALKYAKQGFYVFPVKENGKAPLLNGGHRNATCDPATIEKLWQQYPDANIGLNLEASGLVALDLDTYKDEFECELPLIPSTWMQTTPRGGKHYIFRDMGQKFCGGLTIRGKPLAAIDVKHNGYVVVAPSAISGIAYQVESFGIAADAPDWFLEGAAKKGSSGSATETLPEATSLISPVKIARISNVLGALDPDMPYSDWRTVLMGIHNETDGTVDGLRLATSWSQNGKKYQEGEIESKWAGFSKDGGVTFASVIKMAKDVGWIDGNADSSGDVAGIGVTVGRARSRGRMSSESNKQKLLIRAGSIPLTPPAFAIEGLLERESVSMIFGKSFGGKTFVALDIGLSCASGRAFHGHAVNHPTPVIYAAAEGKNGLVRRCRAWCQKNGYTLEDLPFYVSQVSVTISDEKAMEQFIHEIDQIAEAEGNPSLIFFDTLNRSVAGWSENSTDDMSKLLKQLEHLAKRYECNVCLVHHSGHEADHRGRGSSSLYAGMDQSFKVSNDNGLVRLENDKMKDGEKPSALCFSIESIELHTSDGLLKSAVLALAQCSQQIGDPEQPGINEGRILATLQELDAQGATSEGCITISELIPQLDKAHPRWGLDAIKRSLGSRISGSKFLYRKDDQICFKCQPKSQETLSL